MIVEFDIAKRLYDDLKGWCQVNNIELNKYVSLKLREALTLDKYGDLNEKVKKVQKKQEKKKKTAIPVAPVAEELIPVIPMTPPKPEVTFAPEIEKATELGLNTDNKEEKEDNTEKKRRTLKTK